MGRATRIVLSRDLFEAEGNFVAPGPGLSLIDDIPGLESDIFAENLPDVTPEQIAGYDMVPCLIPKWTADSLKGNDRLLAVHRFGVGYDMVDVSALNEAGVLLTLTREATRRPMASAILTMLMVLSTRLMTKDRITRAGQWNERGKYHGVGLVGRTLGVIGVGNIGHEVFKLAAPLEMRHLGCDPYITQESVDDVGVQLVDMDTILAESDLISICCPLTAETRHMIDETAFKKMKPSAFFVNMARGPIVDEAALIRALSEGWIEGAGIDVFEQEPTPDDNPLLKMDNVIVTPHALCWTDQVFNTQWDFILGQVDALRHGEAPLGMVNPEVWHSPVFQHKLERFLEETK